MDQPVSHCSRRTALRLLGASALILPVAGRVGAAQAARSWCRTDPVFTLDGYFGRVYVLADANERHFNNSSGDILIEHPKDVATNVVWEDPNGYLGQGISTNFAINEQLQKHIDYMDVVIKCKIPAARDDMVIRVEWAPGPVTWKRKRRRRGRGFGPRQPMPNPIQTFAEGYANQWILVQGTLPYDL
jgi:hypothetical protein